MWTHKSIYWARFEHIVSATLYFFSAIAASRRILAADSILNTFAVFLGKYEFT